MEQNPSLELPPQNTRVFGGRRGNSARGWRPGPPAARVGLPGQRLGGGLLLSQYKPGEENNREGGTKRRTVNGN